MAPIVADEVGHRLADREVEVRRDLAELAVEVDEERPVRAAGRDARRPC